MLPKPLSRWSAVYKALSKLIAASATCTAGHRLQRARTVGARITQANVLCLLAIPVMLWSPISSFAQGLELAPQVRALVYTPNINNHISGYWPTVCVIENGTSQRQEVEVRCPEHGRPSVNWRVMRRVVVESGSTARVTLWLPPPTTPYLELEFLVNGRPARDLWRFTGPARPSSGLTKPEFPMVLASGDAARTARFLLFDRYILSEEPQGNGGSVPGMLSGGTSSGTGPIVSGSPTPPTSPVAIATKITEILFARRVASKELQLVVWEAPLAAWDTHWIGYTPFQGMLLTPRDWETAPGEVKDAIIRWVSCGGMLAFLDLKPSTLHPSAATQGQLAEEKSPDNEDATVKSLQVVENAPEPSAIERRRRILADFPATDALASILAEMPEKLKSLEPRPLPSGFGEVYYIIADYAELGPLGGPNKLLSKSGQNLLGPWGYGVEQRYRMLLDTIQRSGAGLTQTLELARGLGVPVLGFFLLLLVFSVVIGPVSILVLTRYNRRIWLVWLVPCVAAICCLVVLAYGFLGEGVRAHINIRSLTLLDERYHRASTVGVIGIYSPITPPGGVQWDYEIEPMFLSQLRIADRFYSARVHYARDRTEGQVRLDWSEKQHLTSGWVVPRVRDYVLARRSEVRRERLTLRRQDDRLWAANNFGTALRNLVLCDHDGRWWRAEHIPAGQEVELLQIEPPSAYTVSLQLVREQPELFRFGRNRLRETDPSGANVFYPHWPTDGSYPGRPNPRNRSHSYSPATAPEALESSTSGVGGVQGFGRPVAYYYCPGALSTWYVAGAADFINQWGWWQTITSSQGPGAETLMCPGRYFAELEASVFLDSGLRWVGVRQEKCWVLGIFDTPNR